MPPNLGGFFMVRSYYSFECHADYFDFDSFPTRRSSDLSSSRSSPRRLEGWTASRGWSAWTSAASTWNPPPRSEEHTSELQSRENLVCRLLLEKKNMHPNLGGFFMLRSYYPSECHSDYFD